MSLQGPGRHAQNSPDVAAGHPLIRGRLVAADVDPPEPGLPTGNSGCVLEGKAEKEKTPLVWYLPESGSLKTTKNKLLGG